MILYPRISKPIYSSPSFIILIQQFCIPLAQTPIPHSLSQQDDPVSFELVISAMNLEKWFQADIKNNQ